MPLYPPHDFSATADSMPFAAGSPRIQHVTYEGLRAQLVHMLAALEGATSQISTMPAAVKTQFQARQAALQLDVSSLLEQLTENQDGDIRLLMGFDAARGKLQQAVDGFYAALNEQSGHALAGLGETESGNKYLWWAGGAFALALGTIAIAVYYKPKKKRGGFGYLNAKFKRAIPAK